MGGVLVGIIPFLDEVELLVVSAVVVFEGVYVDAMPEVFERRGNLVDVVMVDNLMEDAAMVEDAVADNVVEDVLIVVLVGVVVVDAVGGGEPWFAKLVWLLFPRKRSWRRREESF